MGVPERRCLKGSDDAEACKDPTEIALDAVSIGKGDTAEPPQCLEFKEVTTSDAVDMKAMELNLISLRAQS
ncbi:hypothetical protein SAY86_031588 [Trapa natans]|uniref:Uncharacterized protein n=1 Tax=Trapa natans TaxID=22666 RepID=A0AAN7LS02_TRANT|nr:hypothetical protein SAY86_031588 [Trapa natans]